jgi:hypothetical protein
MLSGLLPQRIDRSRKEPDGRTCPAHRAWVRRHHCCVPGCRQVPIECAHVRGGTDGGMGLKPSDRWVISLYSCHHKEQHQIGEVRFQRRYGLDLLRLAALFAKQSPHRHRLS